MPGKWNYVGSNSKGEAKFKRYTNQTLAHVKDYLDTLGICYYAHEDARVIFIYKDKEPKSVYSNRYSYYYTTGRWGNDKREKHYSCEGIEHFMQTYYRTTEQENEFLNQRGKQEDEH